jgi:hypothetical protein
VIFAPALQLRRCCGKTTTRPCLLPCRIFATLLTLRRFCRSGLQNQQIFALNHEDAVEMYLEHQRNLTTLGFIDGSYLDKPTVFPFYDKEDERWTICELADGRSGHHSFKKACAYITAEQASNYTRGKNRLLAEVRNIWLPLGGYVLGIDNSSLKLLHCNPNARDSIFHATVPEFITSIEKAFADPLADSVFICVGDQTWTHDPTDTAGLCVSHFRPMSSICGAIMAPDCTGWLRSHVWRVLPTLLTLCSSLPQNESIIAKVMMTLRPGVIIGCNGWQPGMVSDFRLF